MALRQVSGDFAAFFTETFSSVMRGRIPVPDLQIEYEMPDHRISRVNVELTTGDYRPRQLADKARAGFTLYNHHSDDASRVRRALSDSELTAEILSLLTFRSVKSKP